MQPLFLLTLWFSMFARLFLGCTALRYRNGPVILRFLVRIRDVFGNFITFLKFKKNLCLISLMDEGSRLVNTLPYQLFLQYKLLTCLLYHFEPLSLKN